MVILQGFPFSWRLIQERDPSFSPRDRSNFYPCLVCQFVLQMSTFNDSWKTESLSQKWKFLTKLGRFFGSFNSLTSATKLLLAWNFQRRYCLWSCIPCKIGILIKNYFSMRYFSREHLLGKFEKKVLFWPFVNVIQIAWNFHKSYIWIRFK